MERSDPVHLGCSVASLLPDDGIGAVGRDRKPLSTSSDAAEKMPHSVPHCGKIVAVCPNL